MATRRRKTADPLLDDHVISSQELSTPKTDGNTKKGCISCGLKLTPEIISKMEANKILTALAAMLEGDDSEKLMEIAGRVDLYVQPHYKEHKWCLGVLNKADGELTDLGPIVSHVK